MQRRSVSHPTNPSLRTLTGPWVPEESHGQFANHAEETHEKAAFRQHDVD